MSYQAQTSTPKEMRLVFAVKEQGVCTTTIEQCFVVGSVTYEVNGDITNVTCFDINTGKNEVVATIESGATQNVTFDLSRYLPQGQLSKFLKLIKRNCDIWIFLLRSDECADLTNELDFGVLTTFGRVTNFGNYSTTELKARNTDDTAFIDESTTVSCTLYSELGQQTIATRGTGSTAPFVATTFCDKESCGGKCNDDSDGCQIALSLQNDGVLQVTSNQYTTDTILTAIVSSLTTPVFTDVKCVGKNVVVTAEGATNTGAVYYATITSVLANTASWTELTADTDTVALVELNKMAVDGKYAWIVGTGGSVYQYDSLLNTVTPIATVAGLTTDLNDVAMVGQTIVIVGDTATAVRSQSGGKSFQSVDVIDPVTGITFTGNLTSVGIESSNNWSVGTNDSRILFTFDDGTTWNNQLIESTAGTGTVTSIDYSTDGTNQKYATLTEAGVSRLLKGWYGDCNQLVDMPTNTDSLPANIGLNDVKVCPSDANIVLAVGEITGGTGIILVASGEYV